MGGGKKTEKDSIKLSMEDAGKSGEEDMAKAKRKRRRGGKLERKPVARRNFLELIGGAAS